MSLRESFVPSIFNSVDFWSSVFWIVLDIELGDDNVIRELAVFIDGKFQGYSFCPPKKYKSTKQAFCCTRNLHGIVWNSGCLDYSELLSILAIAVKGEYFAKEQKNARFLAIFWKNRWEIWKITTVPMLKFSLIENWVCSSYPFRHQATLHCAERKAMNFGVWTMQHLKLQVLYCVLYCRYISKKPFPVIQSFSNSISRYWAYVTDDWSRIQNYSR